MHLTHFSNCQDNVALQCEHDRIRESPLAWLRTTKASNLKYRRYWERPQLPVKLKHGRIGRHFGPEGLIM